jgi:tRNA(fMet)-specific endonuclease VapC
MAYLLDTNIFIAAMKGHSAVCDQLEIISASNIVLSTIVLGELQFGAEKSQHCERNRQRLNTLVSQFPLLGINATVCLEYARIRATLERQGTPIGGNDLWIAAQASAGKHILVTDNTREFVRVPGLELANWINLTD